MKEDSDSIIESTKSKINVNLTLLSTILLLLTLIVTINPTILNDKFILAAELTIAIPLIITSTFVRIKLIRSKNKLFWDKIGFVTFTLAYSFLINTIGLFLVLFVNNDVSMLFFGANILMALFYSTAEIISKTENIKSRFYKDALFILILILGGILPSLGVY